MLTKARHQTRFEVEKIRVEETINKSDKVVSSRVMDDPELYRRSFFKLDKAVFIRKEKL